MEKKLTWEVLWNLFFLNKVSSKQEWYFSGICFHCTISGQMPGKIYVTWWPELYKNVLYKSWDTKAEENSASHTVSMRRPKQNKAATKINEIPAASIYLTKKFSTKTDLDFLALEGKQNYIYALYIFSAVCDIPSPFQCKQFGGWS